MPFIPTQYPLGTVFATGRRIKLDGRKKLGLAAPDATRAALFASSYRGEKTAVIPTNINIRVFDGDCCLVVESTSEHSSVLFFWRDESDDSVIRCGLAEKCPSNLFVSMRGAPRFAGEPRLDVDADEAEAPVAGSVKLPPRTVAATSVEEALETLRSALQPKATVDEDLVRSLVDAAVKPLRDEIERLSEPGAVKVRARAAVARAVATGSSPILTALASRYSLGQDAPAIALLAAPPSLGKTYSIRQFAESYDLFLEHGCSEDIEEIATLLGGPVPDGDGGFITVDGVLTQAVRAASEGQKVMLLLDEVLRWGEAVQEWFLPFATGVKTAAGRKYRLRTRRVIDGALEVLECDAENLHLVAAANLGARQPQDAFWSRFDVVRFGFDAATVQGVATAVASSYGIKDTPKLALNFTKALTATRRAVSEGHLRYPLDVRVLERACQLASGDTAKDVLTYLATRVSDVCAHWSVDLGETDPASTTAVEAVTKILTEGI